MKEAELRRHTKCSVCNKGICHTRLPTFVVLRVEVYQIDGDAMVRQDGLAAFLGSTELAEVMGTNEDMATCSSRSVVTLCLTCASENSAVAAGLAP